MNNEEQRKKRLKFMADNRMRGLWITPVYWLQKADLYFYKRSINATGSLVLLIIYVVKLVTF